MIKEYRRIYLHSSMKLQDIENGTGIDKSVLSKIFKGVSTPGARGTRKASKWQIIALNHYFSQFLFEDFDNVK